MSGKIYGFVEIEVAEGAADEFRRHASACVEAAKADLAGTLAYEWFLSEDGRRATVAEIYDDAEAIGRHTKHVGPLLAPILEIARFRVDLAGDVPDALVERMRRHLGAVRFFGPLFRGKLRAPAAGAVGPDAGRMIFAIARFKVHEGQEAEFRARAGELFDLVDANEPDTLAYDWFLNEDGSEALVLDVYRDVAAMGAHRANAGAAMGRLLPLFDGATEVLGALPEEMRGRFRPELGVRYAGPQIEGIL